MRLWVLTPPWRRAPRIGLRQPGVLAAVVGAAVILGVAAASGPVFLASTGAAALQRLADQQCVEADRPTARYGSLKNGGWSDGLGTPEGLRTQDAVVRGAIARHGLPAPYRVLQAAPEAAFGTASVDRTVVTLYSRPDALAHVKVLRSTGGRGVYISDLEAERRHVDLGDPVTVGSERTTIVGVYRDLNGPGFGLSVPPYWCTWSQQLLVTLEHRPPPFLITDEATIVRLAAVWTHREGNPLPLDTLVAAWYSPADLPTLDTAARAVRRSAALREELDHVPVGYLVEDALPEDLASATRTRDGLRGPVQPISIAATLVALLLIGGAGMYWSEQRAAEVRLLGARGAGPFAIGVKAVLELALPVLAGAALGYVVARELVRRIGPSAQLEPSAATAGGAAVAVAAGLGLVLLGVIAAVRARVESRRRPLARRWWVLVPWELALLGLAALAYGQVHEHGGITVRADAVSVDPLLIAFPLLALAGGLLLAARLCAFALPALRRLGDALPTAPHLATRRVTGGRAVTLTVLVLTAVPIGLLVYAGAIPKSNSATVEAKARTYIGADMALVAKVPPATQVSTGGHGTAVSVIRTVHIGATDGLVLGVDPTTFAQYAYWDEGLVGATPPALLSRLSMPDGAQPVPAILVGCADCDSVAEVTIRTTRLPIRVVARTEVFPGMRMPGSPMVVVNQAALSDVDSFADRAEEVWTTHSELSALTDVLSDKGVAVLHSQQPDRFLDNTNLLPVSWILGYLQALAALTGLVAVAALLLYLAARGRHRVAAYVLARRMGVSRAAHLRSLLYEVAGLLGAAWVLGVGLGWVAVGIVYRSIDLNPTYAPPPLLRLDVGVVVGAAVGLVVVIVLGALTAQRSADRTKPAEVMRLGT